MSTLPGQDSWRDAGLVDQDEEIVSLAQEKATPAEDDPAEYRPRTPRPDLDDRAAEADVVDQAAGVPIVDEDGS